jgi:hypothetical protein
MVVNNKTLKERIQENLNKNMKDVDDGYED